MLQGKVSEPQLRLATSTGVPDIPRNLARPQSELVRIDGDELVADLRNMVDEPEFLARQRLRVWSRVDVEAREWEEASHAPLLNSRLDCRGPEQIRLLGAGGSFLRRRHVVVRAPNLVLGAVAAELHVSTSYWTRERAEPVGRVHIPLGEVLVAPNMPTLADGVLVASSGRVDIKWWRQRKQLTRFHSPYETLYGYSRVRTLREWGEERVIMLIAYLRRGGPPPGPAILMDWQLR